MTKKDYQAIARAIHGTKPSAEDGWAVQAWRETYGAVADVMAADSPRFDRARFLEACETGTTRGMRKAGA